MVLKSEIKELLPSHSWRVGSSVTCLDLFWSLILLSQYQLLSRTSPKNFFPISSIYFPKAIEECQTTSNYSKAWKSQVTDLAATSIFLKHEFYHVIPCSRTYNMSLLLQDQSVSITEHPIWCTALWYIQEYMSNSFFIHLKKFYWAHTKWPKPYWTLEGMHRWLRCGPHPREPQSLLEWTNVKTIITIHRDKSTLKIYAQNSMKPKRRHHREVNTYHLGFQECIAIYQRTSRETSRKTVPQAAWQHMLC